MSKLSLHWPLDRDGYRLEAGEVVRNGGELDFGRDVMKIAGLYQRLAEHPRSEKGALAFVSKFGFLQGTRSENVDYICNEIEAVQQLLRLKKARNWEALHVWMMDNRKGVRLIPEIGAGDPPELSLSPSSLRAAIYLQFLQDLSTGASMKLCKRGGCGEWFYIGPGTKKSTAEYCSPKCQKAHAYEKSKGGK